MWRSDFALHLLHIQIHLAIKFLCVLLCAVAMVFHASAYALTQAEQLTMKPYDEKDYQMGYAAFLASGELLDAWRVAKSAVQQKPEDLVWRQRLAQLSEWTQKRQDAYTQWLYLYRHDRGNHLANEAVLRLAPVMGDKHMLLSLWLARHVHHKLDDLQLAEVSNLFEATGKVDDGVRFFEKHYATNLNPSYLAAAARLQIRVGQDAEALTTYRRLLASHPPKADWLMGTVMLMLRKKDNQGALAVMEAYQSAIPEKEVAFWQLLGNMSWLQQKNDTSIGAYKKLTDKKEFTDLQRERLYALLQEAYPDEAIRLARDTYRQKPDEKNLLKLLSFLSQQQDWQSFAAIVRREIDPELLLALEKKPEFLLMRAQYYVQNKEKEAALADVNLAYQLGAKEPATAAQVLWHFIGVKDMARVKELVRIHGKQALDESAFWQPFAAANHELDDIPQAMAFYQKQLSIAPKDALWMLNYADAVARSGQVGMSDRIRRQAWSLLQDQKEAGAEPTLPLSRNPQLLAYANLVLKNLEGDGADQYMRRIVNRLRGLDAKTQDDQQTNDFILSLAINSNAIPAAKLWLMGRYGKNYKSQAPLWGQTTVALQQNDTQTLARLNQNPDGLPPYDRHDIAQALEFEGQAAQIAFDNMRGNKSDNPMHDRYVSTYMRQANLAGIQMDAMQGDSLNRFGGVLYTNLRIAPHWHLGLEVARNSISQDNAKAGVFANTNNAKRGVSDVVNESDLLGLSLAYKRSRYQWSVATHKHHVLDDWWSGEAQGSYTLSRHWSLGASMRYAMPNRDNTAMSFAAVEDVLQASALYSVTVRDYLRLSTQLAQYRTQTDRYLGTGAHVDWEIGHRIRTEYPDWNIKLLGAHRRYQRDGSADALSMSVFKDPTLQTLVGYRESAEYFLPKDTDYFALCAGAGQTLSERRNLDGTSQPGRFYSKAWRPLAEVCATYNSAVNATGYSGLAGLRGSIDGEDQMLLVYQESSGGLQLPNQTTRAITAKYERLF